ncbi:hypothetical protein [Nocardioides marmotae]|uniref:Uncharacterized protein n=1 Tax=Nocardioides marmotae TaxID=2663857 RepID=A0A6I3JGJ6_9ACTN|nr:hypothetical protein [Nocardioides marmotae]MCR6033415.1 hypothetical protein [Gordonia jinghuaiqii]MBC9734719.1 hypothetical protein [Nocardioides marmotae]MTB85821.1 hypothetical protein [Nocardioides marmotae]MTB97073.1 hypothetical protein [Nocardioides marmotae]QKE00730.1 hypothetical protein HPC71_06310 [Nocardioides marmotae]
MTASISPVRRAAALLSGLSVVLTAAVVQAAPATADVPEGWSDPDPVNTLHAVLLFGGVPLLLFIVIWVVVYAPAMIRGERVTPGSPAVENQWIGGPRKSTSELAGPDGDDSQAGGASARW